MGRLAAVTGATGFLGRHIVHALARDGWTVRVLARRAPDAWIDGASPEVVRGDLADADALAKLCAGADAVVHAAGLVSARRDADFDRVNAQGAADVATVARAASPGADFLLVSSLAAREPGLSAYARSKRAGEAAAQAVYAGAAQVARPCAVYGPGDRAGAGLFHAAARWPALPLPSPRDARLTLVHVADCARDIARMVGRPEPGRTSTLTDDRLDGYGWARDRRGAGVRRRCATPADPRGAGGAPRTRRGRPTSRGRRARTPWPAPARCARSCTATGA